MIDTTAIFNDLTDVISDYTARAQDIEKLVSKTRGGQLRDLMGKLGEEITTRILNYVVQEKYSGRQINIYEGSKKRVLCKKSPTAYLLAQVDRHIDVDNLLVGVVESKTYCDKTFLQRAIGDIETIKKYTNNGIYGCVIALQRTIKESTLNFLLHDTEVEIFFLMEGGRKDIHKGKSFISKEKLDACVNGIFDKI